MNYIDYELQPEYERLGGIILHHFPTLKMIRFVDYIVIKPDTLTAVKLYINYSGLWYEPVLDNSDDLISIVNTEWYDTTTQFLCNEFESGASYPKATEEFRKMHPKPHRFGYAIYHNSFIIWILVILSLIPFIYSLSDKHVSLGEGIVFLCISLALILLFFYLRVGKAEIKEDD